MWMDEWNVRSDNYWEHGYCVFVGYGTFTMKEIPPLIGLIVCVKNYYWE